MSTYLTAKQLADRLHYHPVYINQSLKDSIFLEGIHYVRPFGGRKILYLWEEIENFKLVNLHQLLGNSIFSFGITI